MKLSKFLPTLAITAIVGLVSVSARADYFTDDQLKDLVDVSRFAQDFYAKSKDLGAAGTWGLDSVRYVDGADSAWEVKFKADNGSYDPDTRLNCKVLRLELIRGDANGNTESYPVNYTNQIKVLSLSEARACK